ncbi:type VII secretion-associated serine protease mycosin [Nonomuraea mangrovi]|uniref:Type VII secretion-associated serine protease mycosin n=1 Tax=Nonomuraea mangrovi TaxID=2316207 RepID=A0ABW4TDX9_9ACTN
MRRALAAPLVAALLAISTPTVADEVAATARERQWQLGTLHMEQAWRLTRGAGVTVAVLDTGVDARHPDLAGAVVKGPDLTGQAPGGGRWGHHGTGMASLIAGRGHGKGRADGVIGIAPESTVLSVRVTLENDDPRRELQRTRTRGQDSLARGIRYAVDHGAQVISMSLGGGSGTWEGSAAEEEAVQYALERGAVLVASAGNDGDGPNRKNFPAAYPGVIAVGAVDRKLKVAGFSNRQTYLSVVAPGKQIVSADGPRSYVIGDGTSSAAAMVAGIAALVRSAYPDLTPLQVRRAIESGADREGHSKDYGHGVVNAAHALAEARRLGERDPVTTPAGRPYFGGGPSDQGTDTRLLVIAALLALAATMAARVVALSRRRRR